MSKKSPLSEALNLAFGIALVLWSFWAAHPVFTLVAVSAVALLFVLLHWRHVLNAFRSNHNEAETNAARAILFLFSAAASLVIFLWAIFADESSTPSLIAGTFGLVAVRVAKAHFNAHRVKKGFVPALVDNFTEALLLFTVIAGIYATASFILDYRLEGGSITLGQLRRFDDSVLYWRVLLDNLQFSSIQTIALTVCFLVLRWAERNWMHRPSTALEFVWRVFRSGTKWMTRTAMAALFAASFTFLAVHQDGPFSHVSARLRDFEESYSQLQSGIKKSVDHEVKRELISNAWARLGESEQKEIRRAIRNRKAAQHVEQEYRALAELGFSDPRIESILSETLSPIPSGADTSRPKGPVEGGASVPTDLDNTSLGTIKASASEAAAVARSEQAIVPEPIEEMDSTIRDSVMDIALDSAKEHLPVFTWLDDHIPGLGEILNSIKDAGGDALFERLKQAKDRIKRKKLASPKTNLKTLIAEESHTVASSLPQPVLQTSGDSGRVFAEADKIQKTEVSLRHQAPKTIEAALKASRTSSARMASQLQTLEQQFPELRGLSLESISGQDNLLLNALLEPAGEPSSTQKARLDALEKLKAFADPASIASLRQQLRTEQNYEKRLVAIVGVRGNDSSEVRNILGPDFNSYAKTFEEQQRQTADLVRAYQERQRLVEYAHPVPEPVKPVEEFRDIR